MLNNPLRRHYGAFKPPLGAMLDRAHPLAQGLVAYWLLNEHAGTYDQDLISMSNPLTLSTPAWGGFGSLSGAGFNGGMGSAALPTTKTSGVSVLIRIVMTDTAFLSSFHAIFYCGNPGSNGWGLYCNSNGAINLLCGGIVENSFGYIPSVGQALDLVLVNQTPGTWLLYVNGAEIGSVGGSPAAPAGKFGIAGVVPDGQTINALVSDCVVWERSLSAVEIASLCTSPYQMFGIPGARFFSLGGTAWLQSLTETLSLTDSRFSAPSKATVETLSLTDTRSSAASKAASETLTITDSRSSVASKGLLDTFALTDSAVMKAVAKALGEVLALTDSRSAGLSKAISEALDLADAVSSGQALYLLLTETLSLTDTRVSSVSSTLAEALELSDSRAATVTKGLAEIFGISDARAAAVAKALAQSFGLTDNVSSGGAAILILLAILSAVDGQILDGSNNGGQIF